MLQNRSIPTEQLRVTSEYLNTEHEIGDTDSKRVGMHRKQGLLVLAATCALALAARTISAQEPATGEISGRVTNGHGAPLHSAHIDVTDHATGSAVSTLTRLDGRYTVSGLALGHSYDVLVRSIGYAPLRRAASLPDTVAPGDSADPIVDAVLLPIDVPSPPATTWMTR